MRTRLLAAAALSAVTCFAGSSPSARADEPQKCTKVQGVNSSWEWCENRITRMTQEERARLTSPTPIEFAGKPSEPGPTSMKWRGNPVGDPAAAKFSWHDLGGKDWMTPPRSQGSCGSCFVFGSLGAMESQFKYMAGDPLLDVDLAEQSVISCISLGSCSSGGTAEEVGMRLKSEGATDESCYPYTQTDGTCDNLCTDWASRTGKITDWHMSIIPWSDDEMKAQLVYAPMVVNMQTYSDFDGYKTGVYSRSDSATKGGWHIVTLVGWDDSDNSWIVRNSWGDDWGMAGYFKMSRESDCMAFISGVCFASHLVYFDIEHNDMPGVGCVYQHDVKMTAVQGDKAKVSIDTANCGANHAYTIKYAFNPKVSWIGLTANNPTLAPGETTKVNLTADSATLPVGTHKTALKLIGGAGINWVNVEFVVTSDDPPGPDAGPEASTGKDASVPGQDASTKDAGKDAAKDGTVQPGDSASGDEPEEEDPPVDIPAEPATLAPPAGDDGGCGCRTAGAGSSGWSALLAVAAACVIAVRRRRPS